LELKVVQSNHEGVLIDTLHAERSRLEGVVMSPAGLFGSYPLKEALEAVGVPAIEVYLERLGERVSVVGEACAATIEGQGFHSYLEALERFANGDLTGELMDEEREEVIPPSKALARPSGGATKTLGRKVKGAPGTPAADFLTRALVRRKIADRLAGRLTPAELASWARTKWTEVQRGAPAENGHREFLEDCLQRLTLSTMPASKLSDPDLVDMMTRLEG
jgi:3-dehydroquinate dehydratase-2